jgi:hypothetical protein
MFASHGASEKRRWGCAERLGELDGCYLDANSENRGDSLWGEPKPDVHLIKQVEQVDNVGFGRTDVALRPDSEHRSRTP